MTVGRLNKLVVSQAGWALLGELGSAAILLLGMRALTEVLPPAVYGEVTLLVGVSVLGLTVFSYPLMNAGMRFLPEFPSQEQQGILRRTLTKLTRQMLVAPVSIITFGGGIYAYSAGKDPWGFLVLAMLFIVTARRDFEVHMLIGARRQREASIWQTIDSLLRPLLSIGMALVGGAKATMALLGYLLATGLANILCSRVMGLHRTARPQQRIASDRLLERQIATYAWPFVPLALLSWFNNLGDRYIIGYVMTPADVGIYAAVYSLANEAFNRSAMLLRRVFQPIFFQYSSENQRQRVLRIFVIWLGCVVAMGIAGVLLLVVLHGWVATLLLAESYRSASSLMPIIGAGCALSAAAKVLAQPSLANKHSKAPLVGRTFGVVAAAITIPIMVANWGLFGAAVASPIYFGIEAFAMAAFAIPWWKNLGRQTDPSCLCMNQSIFVGNVPEG